MAILDGDGEGLARAAALICANPHPEHLREARLTLGRDDIRGLVDSSIRASALIGYATRGDTAMAGGVGRLEETRIQVWMTATADAPEHPAWLLRHTRRIQAAVDRRLKPGAVLWQAIPADYARGLRFVRRMGYRESSRLGPPLFAAEIVLVERDIVA